MPKTVVFNGYEARVDYGAHYSNGRQAIRLFDGHGQVAVATANVPGAPLGPREALIKDYSENEGMLAALVAAGIVRDTGRRVASGFIELPVVEIVDPDAPVNRELHVDFQQAMAQLAAPSAGQRWEH